MPTRFASAASFFAALEDNAPQAIAWLEQTVPDYDRLLKVIIKGSKMGNGRHPDALSRLIKRTIRGLEDEPGSDATNRMTVLHALYTYDDSDIGESILVDSISPDREITWWDNGTIAVTSWDNFLSRYREIKRR